MSKFAFKAVDGTKAQPLPRHWGFRYAIGETIPSAMTMLTNHFVGYNPQKLLPAPKHFDPYAEFRQYVSSLMGDDLFGSFIVDRGVLDEEIVFHKAEPRRHVNFKGLYDDDPSLMRWREPTYEHKVAVIDMSKAEMRVLAAMMDNPRVRDIVLDCTRDIERATNDAVFRLMYKVHDEPKHEAPVAKKKQPAYLKHDPMKRHKRWRPRK